MIDKQTDERELVVPMWHDDVFGVYEQQQLRVGTSTSPNRTCSPEILMEEVRMNEAARRKANHDYFTRLYTLTERSRRECPTYKVCVRHEDMRAHGMEPALTAEQRAGVDEQRRRMIVGRLGAQHGESGPHVQGLRTVEQRSQEWSAELRRLQAEAREKERHQVVLDVDWDMNNAGDA